MDLFREMERSLRTYPERLPIDDFLPPPEQIPTGLPEPARYEASPSAGPDPSRKPLTPQPASGETPPPPRETAPGQLDREVREYLEQQKARGRHDPTEWVQEKEPDPGPAPAKPSPGSNR